MFIKRGDGKIISVIDDTELSDEQKKSLKDLSKKTSEDNSKLKDKVAER